jgi:hypothetical protein
MVFASVHVSCNTVCIPWGYCTLIPGPYLQVPVTPPQKGSQVNIEGEPKPAHTATPACFLRIKSPQTLVRLAPLWPGWVTVSLPGSGFTGHLQKNALVAYTELSASMGTDGCLELPQPTSQHELDDVGWFPGPQQGQISEGVCQRGGGHDGGK